MAVECFASSAKALKLLPEALVVLKASEAADVEAGLLAVKGVEAKKTGNGVEFKMGDVASASVLSAPKDVDLYVEGALRGSLTLTPSANDIGAAVTGQLAQSPASALAGKPAAGLKH